ncbi:hypothetical protein M3Y94_00521600 [Aphelenchoides besseyi]|nr:hypothetical protein M3Y94_00521600 [Aphelenchoides besseyi]
MSVRLLQRLCVHLPGAPVRSIYASSSATTNLTKFVATGTGNCSRTLGLPHCFVNNLAKNRICRKAMSTCDTWFLDMATKRKLTVVLASESPRRLQLLQQIGIEPIVEVSGYDENIDKSIGAEKFVKECSRMKAKFVADRWIKLNKPFDFLIAADTMLNLYDGTIIGKAVDEEDAMRILRSLSGRSHDCLTGVTIINSQGRESTFVSKTTVEFSDISDQVLRNYIETGEYKGCAGAYRIQGRAAVFVRSITGDYSNVVGLPIHEVAREMQKLTPKQLERRDHDSKCSIEGSYSN